MIQMIVTGKIEKVTMLPDHDTYDRCFVLVETYYVKGHGKMERAHRVFVPAYKSAQANALLKEGYSIGVQASEIWINYGKGEPFLEMAVNNLFIL